MLDLLVEDEKGTVELGVFDRDASEFEDGLKEGDLVVVECLVVHDKERKDSAIRVKALHPIAQFRMQRNARVEIDIAQDKHADNALKMLRDEFNDIDQDGCSVIINYQNEQYSTSISLDRKWQLVPTEELLDRLEDHFGTESVRVFYPSN